MARAAIDADPADDREHQVLGGHSRSEASSRLDAQCARPALQQALRREHVADFGRADAEGEGAERAVRARVAVTADDRPAGLRRAELGADDVDDAAAVVAQAEEVDAELGAIALELANLPGRGLERDRHAAEDLRRVRRGRVIHGRERAVRAAQLQAPTAQHGERLRRSHLVHEVQVDVQDSGRVGGLGHHLVALPDLLEQGLGRHRQPPGGPVR